jgi:hypothetical protein
MRRRWRPRELLVWATVVAALAVGCATNPGGGGTASPGAPGPTSPAASAPGAPSAAPTGGGVDGY